MDGRGGFDAATSLLKGPSRATALVAASLASAVGAMAAARSLGLSVPNDVSVTGFHDAPIAAYLHPALTTVRMPLREMAEVAVRTLVGLIGGEASGDVTIATAPVLITRGSTAAPCEGATLGG